MSDAELSNDKKIDDYQLVASIASGNASQIWEVRDAAGQTFAMKLLLPDAFKNPEQVGVLKHEAKVGQSLEHPNFIRTMKFVKSKTHCYMLMELFKCPNLKASLQSEEISVQGRFGRLAEQLCSALGFMHEKGWLHHDLKPDNILFSKSSELKILDFSLSMRRKGGLGKMVGGKVKVVQGTRTYIAPETIKKEYPTPQSDMYSLGITLFEVLAGQPPFVASSPNDLLIKHLSAKPPEPSAFNPNVTAEADKFILRLLSKKPAHRPKDMAEVAAELRSLKVFKRDPLELAAEEEEKKKAEGLGLAAKSRLDSRADAARTAAGVAAPERAAPRKPTASALRAARKAGLAIPGEEPEAPPQQQPDYNAYQPAAWGQYAPQGYWPQYGPPQGDPQQGQGYYQYPPQGGQSGAPYPPQPAQPGNYPYPPTGYPPQGGPQPSYPDSSQSVPQPPVTPPQPQQQPPNPPNMNRSAPTQPPAPNAPVPQPIPLLPGMGRGPERHPTQLEVDSEDIPEMDELPDVL